MIGFANLVANIRDPVSIHLRIFRKYTMGAHFLQHVPFEGPGSIEAWLRSRNYGISRTRFFESTVLPDPSRLDLLVILGGPMSIHDEGEFPWLSLEKKFIRHVIGAGKSVLGICLGAQLIADAMGATVCANEVKEIGWFPVQGVPELPASLFAFPSSLEVFHWHGETFDLPPGATRIAASQGCTNQAFQLGPSVMGLQFHLEATPASVRELVSHCRAELIPSQYVQTEEQILSAAPEQYDEINRIMDRILSFLQQGNGG